jgi:hypothetical protein
MLRRSVIGLLVAAAALGGAEGEAPHQAAAGATTPLQVVAQRGGLRLELTIPRGSYPRDALVRVRAIARNTTRHTIWIETPGPIAPGTYFPQVEVLNGAGLPVPISLTNYFPYPGPPPDAGTLQPGETVGGAEDIVLRGSWVRLEVTVLRGPEFPVRTRFGLETRAARVHLLPPDPPNRAAQLRCHASLRHDRNATGRARTATGGVVRRLRRNELFRTDILDLHAYPFRTRLFAASRSACADW